jgi:hypothetical protein
MADAPNRNAQLGAEVFSQNPPIGSNEGALSQLPRHPTELAILAPAHLTNPGDFAINGLENDDDEVDDVVLRDPAYFGNKDFENIKLQVLPRQGNVPDPQQAGGSNMNFLSHFNQNFDQLHMNFLRARPAQATPRQDPARQENAPDPANPEELNMNFYKPQADPRRPYYIGFMGLLMALLVTMSSLYGTCAGQAKPSHKTKPHTSVQTSISTNTTTSISTATSITTTTPSTSIQSITTSVPTTITVSTTQSATVTSTLIITPAPVTNIMTSTLVVTPPPETTINRNQDLLLFLLI